MSSREDKKRSEEPDALESALEMIFRLLDNQVRFGEGDEDVPEGTWSPRLGPPTGKLETPVYARGEMQEGVSDPPPILAAFLSNLMMRRRIEERKASPIGAGPGDPFWGPWSKTKPTDRPVGSRAKTMRTQAMRRYLASYVPNQGPKRQKSQ